MDSDRHRTIVIDQLTAALAGRYEIERQIGRGGMATVFLARDVKHHRRVAVKVLDPELGALLGADRFLSEIRVTANLQHPNLLPLFDSGEAGGLLFYVMPYVEGESLRSRLERETQLPVEEAVRVASAIAGALDYAHRHDVIHRDLKPENVLLHDGQPLIADFGIALAVRNAGGERVTQTGLSLGTPQYMSPEQAMGDRNIDARTDVYSLGALAYEMLAGEPPHTGRTAQAVIAKLMTEEPRPLTAVRRTVPPHVDAAVQRALEKLPADRFATAREFADALQGRTPTIATAHAIRPKGAPPKVVKLLSSPIWALAFLLAATGVVWQATRAAEQPDPIRVTLAFRASEEIADFIGTTNFALSPDGRTIAYIGARSANGRVFVRSLIDLTTREIAGTEGARDPFFSPDGRWIGFIANGRLKKMPTTGGAIVDVAAGVDAAAVTGAPAWTEPGDIVFAVANDPRWPGTGIVRAGSNGALSAVTKAQLQRPHRAPVIATDGRTILFVESATRITGATSGRLGIASLDGTQAILDLPLAAPVGMVDDYLVYLGPDNALMGVRLDLGARRTIGEPVRLLEGVRSPSLSSNGTLMYMPGGVERSLVLMDGRAGAVPLLDEPRSYGNPRYSPDGTRIAVDIVDLADASGPQIWIYTILSGTLTKLTSTGGSRPEWSPDGKRIVFRQTGATGGLAWQPADGSGPAEELVKVTGGPNEGVISPDGKFLMYRTDDGQGSQDIFYMSLDGNGAKQPFVTGSVNWAPRFSPDGRWVAYSSDESGRAEIYIRPFPGPGGRVQISNDGGLEPVWSRNGKSLYYMHERGVIRASLSFAPTPSVLGRELHVPGPLPGGGPHASYDIAPAGDRVLIAHAMDESADPVLVLNWATDVRARMAAKRQE